jgi:hypothetical protein
MSAGLAAPAAPPREGRTGRTLGWILLTAGCTAIGGFVAGMLAVVLTLSADNVKLAVVVRGLFVVTAVLLITWAVSRRAGRRGIVGLTPIVLTGALVGYLADPFSWSGRTALAQLGLDPGLAAAVGDLALWMLVAALGIWWGGRHRQARTRMATPYG